MTVVRRNLLPTAPRDGDGDGNGDSDGNGIDNPPHGAIAPSSSRAVWRGGKQHDGHGGYPKANVDQSRWPSLCRRVSAFRSSYSYLSSKKEPGQPPPSRATPSSSRLLLLLLLLLPPALCGSTLASALDAACGECRRSSLGRPLPLPLTLPMSEAHCRRTAEELRSSRMCRDVDG